MKYINKALEVIGSAVFASNCIICKDPVFRADTMCYNCWNKIVFIAERVCKTCGRPLQYSHQDQVYCSNFCATRRWFLKETRASTIYSTVIADIIHQFKYEDQTRHVKMLTNLLLHAAKYIEADIELIIPVPMHHKSLKSRGYNQAVLIAKSFAHIIKKRWSGDILFKTKQTNKQMILTKAMRICNVKDSFAVQNKHLIEGKKILLIDDVITTGATINECAKVLLQSKALNVSALAVART
jgi:ComF family protein